jgi:hypothetical protein
VKNKELVEKLLEQIEFIQEEVRAFDAIVSNLEYDTRFGDGKLDTGNIRSVLLDQELELWRKVFMWAMTIPPKDMDRIKAAAYERFLGEKMCVSPWIGNPTSWSQATEDEFREMARKAFKPADME